MLRIHQTVACSDSLSETPRSHVATITSHVLLSDITDLIEGQVERAQYRRVLAPHRAPVLDVMTLLQRQNDVGREQRVAERYRLELANQQHEPDVNNTALT